MHRSLPLLVAGLRLAGGGCYLPPAQVATPETIRVRVTARGMPDFSGLQPIRHEGPLIRPGLDSPLMWSDGAD